MRTFAKFCMVMFLAVLFGTFVAEWATQLAEQQAETVERHAALVGAE